MQPATAARDDPTGPIGNEELAEGLMLVRASTLKIIRLQLAMERRDQRVALEAVDDLVALDRCLEEFLTNVPSANDDGMFRNVLELERSALNVEKHTLAGGISGRTWQAEAPATDESEAEAEAEAAAASTDISMEEWASYESEPYEFDTPLWFRRVGVLLLVCVVACGAFLLGASGAFAGLLQTLR